MSSSHRPPKKLAFENHTCAETRASTRGRETHEERGGACRIAQNVKYFARTNLKLFVGINIKLFMGEMAHAFETPDTSDGTGEPTTSSL